jgi:hypothetical protein
MIVALLAGVAASDTQPKGASRSKDTAVAAKDQPPAIDPRAIAALKRMGAFLQQQKSFAVHTNTQTDYVLDSGQKIQVSSSGELMVRRPDRLRANTVSDRKERQFYYDGKSFTLYSPATGYYATVPALPTIRQAADQIQERYAVELPLVDLFRFGTDQDPSSEITSAMYVGQARVNGIDTDQYAFRQPGLDWQIWIERGQQPLPVKVVLTTTDDPAQPEHSIELAWTLGAPFKDSVFAFVPPPDSTKIRIAEAPQPVPVDPQQKKQARRGKFIQQRNP